MVTFTSLFLWLTIGTHPVKVAVDPMVASVEIILNSEAVGVATAPQWEVSCNFGEVLRPHELVAVARDENGHELDRALQLVNLPRANAEVEVVFEGEAPDAPTAVRVIAESSHRLEPLAISVSFDGLMLVKKDDRTFALPAYDPTQVHLITAEAHFPEAITARRDVTFGGTYGGRIATELTAIAVTLDKKKELSVEEVEGLFSARGETLKVAAVDRQGGRLYLVRDHATWPFFRQSGQLLDRRLKTTQRVFSRTFAEVLADPGSFDAIPLDQDRYYLVVPNPEYVRKLALYPIVQPFSINRWGLPWLATHIRTNEAKVPGQRLADAVAVAGLRAAGDGCPRMVVLVLGENAEDISEFPPPSVREYLRVLRVPLVVWSTRGYEATADWGDPSTVKGLGTLDKLSRRLLKELRRQWIVWVEGSHLPNEIEVAENDLGIRLAG
jgi:hypothetical protein